MNASLMTVKYIDSSRDVYLVNYADIVVYDTVGKHHNLREKAGYSLYDAQLAVAEAVSVSSRAQKQGL
jgi:hypothetical protein